MYSEFGVVLDTKLNFCCTPLVRRFEGKFFATCHNIFNQIAYFSTVLTLKGLKGLLIALNGT